MKVLIDIGHPAHVHFFKNVIWALEEQGDEVLITARYKDVTHALLDHYRFEHIKMGRNVKGLIGKGLGMVSKDLTLFKICRNFTPDVLMGILNPYIAQVGRVLRKKVITFTDSEPVFLGNLLTLPFSNHILTPESFRDDLGRKHIRYRGYHELAYLHPNHFAPSRELVDGILGSHGPFFLVRFARLTAHHDAGI